VHKIILRS